MTTATCTRCGEKRPVGALRRWRCEGITFGCFDPDHDDDGGWHVECQDDPVACRARSAEVVRRRREAKQAEAAREKAVWMIGRRFSSDGRKPFAVGWDGWGPALPWPEGERLALHVSRDRMWGTTAIVDPEGVTDRRIWLLDTNPAGADGEDRNFTDAIGRALPWSPDLDAAIRAAAVPSGTP